MFEKMTGLDRWNNDFEKNKDLQKRKDIKMPKKGISNNPHGRPPGVPNKMTREIRASLKDALIGHVEGLDKLLMQLEPRDRVIALAKLLVFEIPRLTDSHIAGAVELSAKSRQELSTLEDLDIEGAFSDEDKDNE